VTLPVALRDLHWLGTEPTLVEGTPGPLPRQTDVLVVGGGYVGGATAYWLARRGAEPLLLERRGISTGATGRNAGFIAPGLGIAFAETARRYGLAGAVERIEFTRRGRDLALALIDELAIDCELERSGGLTVAASDAEWDELRESGVALRQAGLPGELLSHDEIAAHLDLPLPATFKGAVFNPETLLVNPVRLNNGIVRAAQQQGARIHPCTEVFALTGAEDGRIAVHTSHGEVLAGRVVLATNAWSPLLAGFLKDRITPVRGQMLATAPAPPAFRRAMSTNHGYEYWSQRVDGTIVLGGARWSVADRDEGYYAEEVNPVIQDALYAFLTTTFPGLAGIAVARRWSGIMGFSRDGFPFIGPMPGRKRLIVAAGFTGHGGPYFALAGKCAAELALDGRSEVSVAPYALDRPL
jgi:gamma-glutamylputrescine oxidase